MVRVALLTIALAACSKSAGNQEKPAAAPPPSAAPAQAAAEAPKAGCGSADDPKFFLKPDEGTLTIDKVDASAGAQATAAVKVAPATGYHMSTDFPISLCLEAPAGVTLAKTAFSAGKGQQGDAAQFSEQALAFSVKATADKPGSYEVKGIFKFGVCDKESCHPKKQPITITVAAK
jgi:hypothetical protein